MTLEQKVAYWRFMAERHGADKVIRMLLEMREQENKERQARALP